MTDHATGDDGFRECSIWDPIGGQGVLFRSVPTHLSTSRPREIIFLRVAVE
jgi:hypothetical protein